MAIREKSILLWYAKHCNVTFHWSCIASLFQCFWHPMTILPWHSSVRSINSARLCLCLCRCPLHRISDIWHLSSSFLLLVPSRVSIDVRGGQIINSATTYTVWITSVQMSVRRPKTIGTHIMLKTQRSSFGIFNLVDYERAQANATNSFAIYHNPWE